MSFTEREYEKLCLKLGSLPPGSNQGVGGQINTMLFFLKEHGISIDDPGAQGHSLMVLAVRNGLINHIPCLLECGAQLAQRDHVGNTVLHHAVYGAFADDIRDPLDPAMMQLLIDKGQSVSSRNNKGETPVFAIWQTLNNPDMPPKLPAMYLRFMTRRIQAVLEYLSPRAPNLFEKNTTGQSFLDAAPFHAYDHNPEARQHLDAVLLPYKDAQEAQNIAQAVAHCGAVNKKSKI